MTAGFRAILMALALLVSPALSPVASGNDPQPPQKAARSSGAQRAAVISVSLEESIVALQAWDRIISLPHTSFDNALVKHMNLAQKEATTFSNAETFNIESLFRMDPDLVLTWVGNDSLIARLEAFSIPMIRVHPRTMNEIADMLEVVGHALGRKDRADFLAGQMRQIHKDLQLKVSPKVRVLWLGGTKTTVYGKKWLFHDLIQWAQGEDVTQGLDFRPWVAQLSVEQIVALDPQVIVIGGWAPFGPQDLLTDPRWAGISAVKAKRIHKTPAGRANYSPYAALMALMTAHWCYPEKFTANRLKKYLNQYHSEFYGVRFDRIHPDFFSRSLIGGSL